MHQIGQVAEAVGLSLRTIRHYDEMGVVVPSGRSAGGFRLYTAEDIDRLRLVKRMKPLDFSLDEMRDVFSLLDAVEDMPPGPERAERRGRLEMYVALVGERRERLREQLAAATQFADTLARAVRKAREDDAPPNDPDLGAREAPGPAGD
jgi:MerR family transcriptional regulator, copper efflux regulator